MDRQDGAADTAPPGRLPARRRVALAGKRTGEVDEKAFRPAISLQLEARFAEGARTIGSPLGRPIDPEERVPRRPWFTLMLGLCAKEIGPYKRTSSGAPSSAGTANPARIEEIPC